VSHYPSLLHQDLTEKTTSRYALKVEKRRRKKRGGKVEIVMIDERFQKRIT
jgi:hypothetical protein